MIQKIKTFIYRNSKWFILVLVALLFLKTCQNMNSKNEVEFTKQEMQKDIDSLKYEITLRNDKIYKLSDSVNVLNNEIKNNTQMIETLNNDKKSYQTVVSNLSKNNKRK